jgi:hypothetical protein
MNVTVTLTFNALLPQRLSDADSNPRGGVRRVSKASGNAYAAAFPYYMCGALK